MEEKIIIKVEKRIDETIDKQIDKQIDKIVDSTLEVLDKNSGKKTKSNTQKELTTNDTVASKKLEKEEKANSFCCFEKFKVLFAFSYFIFFLCLFAKNNDQNNNLAKYKMFYLNQGFVAFMFAILIAVAGVGCYFVNIWLCVVVESIFFLLLLAGQLYCFIMTLKKHKMTELPLLIGKIKIFKF